MAMWKYYHSLELENSINEYIDSIQAIEKNIPSDKIMNQMLDELTKINAQVVLGNTGEYYDKHIQAYTNIIQIRTPKTLNIKNTN